MPQAPRASRTVGGHQVDPRDGLDLERLGAADELVEAEEDAAQHPQARLGGQRLQKLIALENCT